MDDYEVVKSKNFSFALHIFPLSEIIEALVYHVYLHV